MTENQNRNREWEAKCVQRAADNLRASVDFLLYVLALVGLAMFFLA